MARNDQAARLAPYAQELLENAYARENIRNGVEKLRAASRRARKRNVEPTRDEKLRRQLRSAASSIAEGGRALRNRRRKPERRWGPRVAVIAGLGVTGAAAAAWAKQRLTGQGPGPAQPSAPVSADEAVKAAQEAAPA
jgi:hypothetical protein